MVRMCLTAQYITSTWTGTKHINQGLYRKTLLYNAAVGQESSHSVIIMISFQKLEQSHP